MRSRPKFRLLPLKYASVMPNRSLANSIARVAASTLVVLALAGCASGTPTSSGDPAPSSSASAESGAQNDTGGASVPDFCGDFEAAGGNGATVGPVQLWTGREPVLADVGERLTAMNAVEAPVEVQAEWNAMKSYYERIAAAFESTNPDAAVDSEEQALVGQFSAENADLVDDYEAVIDYYFATC